MLALFGHSAESDPQDTQNIVGMLCHISTKIVGVFGLVTNLGSSFIPPGGVHGWVTQKYSSPSGTISSVGSTVVEFDEMGFPEILAPSVH